jgi:hypothetical protein
MKRVLLLAFIHGFKASPPQLWLQACNAHYLLTRQLLQGSDFTFGDFPAHLKETVSNNLGPDHEVASVVYPKYETRGELAQSTAAFLEWYGRCLPP